MDRLARIRTKVTIKHELGRAFLGEFMGTALVTMIGTSVLAQIRLGSGNMMKVAGSRFGGYLDSGVHVWYTMLNAMVGWGLAYAFGYAVSRKLSGGYLNPAISLMFLSFRQMTPLRFFLYCLAETLGAFFGCALTYVMYYDALNSFGTERFVQGMNATADIFASYPNPHLGFLNGFIDQVISTGIYCFVFAHLYDVRNSYPNWLRPFLAGIAFVMIGTAFSFNCGFPDNPARDFGGRLFSLLPYGSEVFSYGNRNMNFWFWIPFLAPLVGGLLGGWIYQMAIGFHSPIDDPDVEVRKYDVEVTQELKPLTTSKGVVVTETA